MIGPGLGCAPTVLVVVFVRRPGGHKCSQREVTSVGPTNRPVAEVFFVSESRRSSKNARVHLEAHGPNSTVSTCWAFTTLYSK